MVIERKKSSAVVVCNRNGMIALQLRAERDDSFPHHWDFAAGGGIDEGEGEMIAAARELREELGVEGELRFVARRHYVYPAWRAGVQRDVDVWVYTTLHDGPFSPNAAEVAHVSFFDLEKIRELAAKEKTLHPELLLALQDGTLAHACTMKV